MRRKLRILLPWAMGAISFLLVLWDVHNQVVIASKGMGWDMGRPFGLIRRQRSSFTS